jgi:hypothetical protein
MQAPKGEFTVKKSAKFLQVLTVAVALLWVKNDFAAGQHQSKANADSAARQRAGNIHRQAVSLLNIFENKLGVRVDDIRSRQLSEQDLDLLLQLQSFVKAAGWYEQYSKPGNNGDGAFSNSSRILLRSARRVEQGMETAPQDRKFSDAWSGIEDNLSQIDVDNSFSVR